MESQQEYCNGSTRMVQRDENCADMTIRRNLSADGNESVLFSSEDEAYTDDDDEILPALNEQTLEVDEIARSLQSAVFVRHPSTSGNFDPNLSLIPEPLDLSSWGEVPPSNVFRVRSKTYITQKMKIPSNPPSLFRLIAVDLLQVDEPIYTGVCALPTERVQCWLRRENESRENNQQSQTMILPPEFIFCVNIFVSGPPSLHLVVYYAVDDVSLIGKLPATISSELNCNNNNMKDSSSVNNHDLQSFKKLASKFFFGPSDEFRDRTFKLVPRIMSGSALVKRAVGSKPTIIGQRVRNIYIRGERFFEVILDVASNRVASKIVKLARGYSKSLVVDMAFLLEGRDESTLPEVILGNVRLFHLDLQAKARIVKHS